MKILKHIILLVLFIWIGFWWVVPTSYWQDTTSSKIEHEVKVTEKVPWANCNDGEGDPKIYTCTVEAWFSPVMQMMQKMVKYFTYIATLAWVLMIVISGIQISMGWMSSDAKENAKQRIIKTIGGLIVLLLSWVILHIIAPWVFV